ncbi:MAG: DsrH/TusB family sulfur metabolism protein [Nitrospirota bacterium]
MAAYLLLISSAPDTKNIHRAISVTEDLKKEGNDINIFLIQEAVRAVVKNRPIEQLNRLINSGIKCYVLEEDLGLRGFRKDDILSNAEVAGYNELLNLMTDDVTSTLGAF